MTTQRRATARDVAQLVGVSQSTVSYVLNNTPNQTIPEATRQRIQEAVAELGYRPSSVARALRTGASQTILVVMPDAPLGASMAELIEVLSDALDPFGYTVVYRRHHPELQLPRLWQELMPGAIVNFNAFSAQDEAEVRAAGIPLIPVRLDQPEPGGISVPQFDIGRLQVQHCVDRGHKVIGYGAPPGSNVSGFYTRRLMGAQATCRELGLPVPQPITVPASAALAAEAVDAWLGSPDPVTAVCAYNDGVAFAVLAGMRLRGLTAPRDLAVIGVDNTPMSQFAAPPLTSVDVHSAEVSRNVAAELITRLIPARSGDVEYREPSLTLVPRETT